jgi:transcription elongation factor GreB
MSRGFVKEDDQEETPIVPPRADLPEGVVNYVTLVWTNERKTRID